ncbi:ArnT family glycosyltransferase [Robbsia betulipollinis]|nr:glycosyl transferase [Robbsia betulipollinis]
MPFSAPGHAPLGTGEAGRISRLALGLAAMMYLLPGILGHEPWKQDETYTFGIIDHILKTGEWLVPMNAGQPFMEKPPLYMWVSSLFAYLFQPLLPPHDGARLASVLFGALALAFGTSAARSANANARANAPVVVGTVALMAGSLVLVKHLHDLFSDVALLAGSAIALASLMRVVAAGGASDTPTGPRRTGPSRTDSCALGIGIGIALMSKGVFIPAVFAALVTVLPLVHPPCRRRRYFSALALALLVSLPFLLIWPALLYRASPTLFMTWFWDNNVGRFLGFSVPELGSENARGFVVQALLTSGFPAGPLALASLALGGWRRLREPAYLIATLFLAIGLAVLSVSATARQLYLLPFMLPAAILAADAVARLPQTLATGWDWISRALFGAAAILVWAAWFIMRQPVETHSPLGFAARWLPLDYVLPLQPVAVLAAVVLTLAWMGCVAMLSAHGRWRGVLSWFAGVTLVWGLLTTLLLPWLDRGKSYGPVFRALGAALQHDWRTDDCMASVHLGESEAPMLYYFTRIPHRPVAGKAATPVSCRWMIVQGRQSQAQVSPTQWASYWRGARQGDTREQLVVYRALPGRQVHRPAVGQRLDAAPAAP